MLPSVLIEQLSAGKAVKCAHVEPASVRPRQVTLLSKPRVDTCQHTCVAGLMGATVAREETPSKVAEPGHRIQPSRSMTRNVSEHGYVGWVIRKRRSG
jgi:hypothetical protein